MIAITVDSYRTEISEVRLYRYWYRYGCTGTGTAVRRTIDTSTSTAVHAVHVVIRCERSFNLNLVITNVPYYGSTVILRDICDH